MKQVRFVEKTLTSESGHDNSCHVVRSISIKSIIDSGEFSVNAVVILDSYKDIIAFEQGLKPFAKQTILLKHLEEQEAYIDASAFFMRVISQSPEFEGALVKAANIRQEVNTEEAPIEAPVEDLLCC